MATTCTNIDYKTQLDKALLINEAQQLTIQTLQLEILQLKKLVFGSRHEKFITATGQNALTLFDVPPIAEVITTRTTSVSYEKATNHLQSNHKGRNPFPDTLRREEQIINPDGIDLTTAKKLGEDVTETSMGSMGVADTFFSICYFGGGVGIYQEKYGRVAVICKSQNRRQNLSKSFERILW